MLCCPDLPDLLRHHLKLSSHVQVFLDCNLNLAKVAEEMLGVNVSYFTGGGTLASMQAVTGCTNAGDAENPGCGAEVPCKEVVSHVAQAEYTRYVASDVSRAVTVQARVLECRPKT